MKAPLFLTGALALAALLSPDAQAAPKVWNNLSGGSWTNGANWTPAGVPGIADTVFITNNGTYQVSLDGNVMVVSLTLGGTTGTQTLSNNASTLTLTAASAVRNNGVLVLGGGSLSGSNGVTVASGGELRLTGSATKTFSALRLLNQGTVSWTDGHIQSDFTAPLTVVTNAGLWQVSSNNSLYYSFGDPRPQFHNTGTFRKNGGGAGTTTVSGWLFANGGMVDVQTGIVAFDNVNGTIGGAWTTAGAAEVRFNSGTYTNAVGASFTGGGSGRVLGGTLWLTGAGAPSGLRLEGGGVLPAPGFQGGSITSLTIHGATLITTGAVNTVSGALVASNGSFSGTLIIASSGQLTLAGAGTKTFSALRLLNQGTVSWLDGHIQSDFTAPLTAVTNAGLWQVTSNHSLYYSFGDPRPQFHNTGTFRKNGGGAGTTTISGWLFTNGGTVDVQTGIVAFDNVNGTIGGAWTTAGATEVRFNSGTYTNAAGASFTGGGMGRFLGTTLWLTGAGAPSGLRLEGGTLALANTFQGGTITNLTLHGGTLNTTNTVTGSLVLSNGNLSGALTVAPSGHLTLAGSATKTFSALRLLNQGTVSWLDGHIQSDFTAPLTVVTNAGLWLLSSNNSLYYSFGDPRPQFHNTGTFRKNGGAAGTTTISGWLFANGGTVDVQTGIVAFDNVNGTIGGGWTAAGTTEVRFNSGNYTNAAGANFAGAGLGRFLGTTLWLTGESAPGGLRLEGGTILLANAFQGGAITNLTIHGATLLTTGVVKTVTGSLVASNGSFSGVLTVAPSGQLLLAGTGTKTFSALQLLNQGTVSWTDGHIQSDFTAPLTVVTNAGLWQVSSNNSLYYSFGDPRPQFHNTGTLRKNGGGAGTTTISGWLFANAGAVDVQTGIIALDNVNGTIGGAWSTANSTEVRFNSGTYTNAAGASFTGAGAGRFLGTTLWLFGAGAPTGLRLEGGAVMLAPGFQGGTITSLTIHGSTLVTTGAVNTVSGSLVASNGAFSGVLNIPPAGQLILAGTGTKTFSALRLFNQGTVSWLDGHVQSDFTAPLSTVTNAGLWQLASDNSLYYSFGTPSPQFHNTGTFRKTAGVGTTTISGWDFSNSGTLDVQAGTLTFGNSPSLASGLIHLANANISFSQPQLLTGRLQGAGTIGGTITNSGVIAPTNTGAIIITGGYYQNASAGPRLEFTLGGIAPGTNYSVLRVNGTANTGNPIVDGSIVVKLATGFSPALASRFDVLTAATLVAGPASNITAGPATFQVQTNATRLSLLTTATGPAQPALTIVPTGGGVRVSWPATPGYVLQTTTNLNTVPGSWVNVPGSPNPYNTPGTDPKRFFRLIRP